MRERVSAIVIFQTVEGSAREALWGYLSLAMPGERFLATAAVGVVSPIEHWAIDTFAAKPNSGLHLRHQDLP